MKSISVPFRFNTNGVVSITEDTAIIAKQKIIDVLVTDKYERVNNPDYGLAINSLLFSPFDPLIFSDYKIDAISDLNNFVSNAQILDIEFTSPDSMNNYSESTLTVRVIYRTNDGTLATLVANVNPNTILTDESKI